MVARIMDWFRQLLGLHTPTSSRWRDRPVSENVEEAQPRRYNEFLARAFRRQRPDLAAIPYSDVVDVRDPGTGRSLIFIDRNGTRPATQINDRSDIVQEAIEESTRRWREDSMRENQNSPQMEQYREQLRRIFRGPRERRITRGRDY